MWKRIAIGGGVVAAVLGIGGAALAVSGSTSSSPRATTHTSGQTKSDHSGLGRKHLRAALGARAVHAHWVTRSDDGTFVAHDAIRGHVTAVSATSITVKAADATTEIYRVTGQTKVHVHSPGHTNKGAISQVKVGDNVLVVGVDQGSALNARQVVDIK